MSRGRYRRRRQRRDEQFRAAAINAAQADIAAEDHRLHTARHRTQAAAAARARLQAETELARRRLAPVEDDAQQAAQRVAQPWQRLQAALVDLRRVDDRLTPVAGPPRRAAAAARARHALAVGIRISATDIHRSAPDGYRRYCYRTRLGAGEPETTLSLQGWIPNGTPTDRNTLARYALSTPHATTPQAGWCWAIPPWLNLSSAGFAGGRPGCHPPAGCRTGWVSGGAGVVIERARGQQVPRDHQNLVGERHDRLLLALPAHHLPVVGRQVGALGLDRRPGALGEHTGQPPDPQRPLLTVRRVLVPSSWDNHTLLARLNTT